MPTGATDEETKDTASTTTTTVEERWRIRRWRRIDPPTEGFWPWGLLPLAGLAGVFLWGVMPFAKQTVEASVRERVRQVLAAEGMGWVRVEADGQNVMLRGQLPRADDDLRTRALSLAEGAACPTWLGAHDCTLGVRADFEAPPAPPPPPPPPPPAEWPDYRFSLREGVLRLTGSVPDEATHAEVLRRAQALVAPPKVREVIDALRVTGRPAPEPFRAVCERGLTVLSGCDAGSASLVSGVFALHCDVTRATRDAVDAAARAPLEGMRLGDVELLVREEVMACEQALDAILRASTINFQINSAVIAPTNGPLLDRVAAAARQCPGILRIEGHTDGSGLRAANMTLSDARAASVRVALSQRGLAEARLRSQGFGPDRPVADNVTVAGRARNRRIEIHVVHDGE
jgi:outer membrane protein OmpA-like peptidoglycan-associated protein